MPIRANGERRRKTETKTNKTTKKSERERERQREGVREKNNNDKQFTNLNSFSCGPRSDFQSFILFFWYRDFPSSHTPTNRYQYRQRVRFDTTVFSLYRAATNYFSFTFWYIYWWCFCVTKSEARACLRPKLLDRFSLASRKNVRFCIVWCPGEASVGVRAANKVSESGAQGVHRDHWDRTYVYMQ